MDRLHTLLDRTILRIIHIRTYFVVLILMVLCACGHSDLISVVPIDEDAVYQEASLPESVSVDSGSEITEMSSAIIETFADNVETSPFESAPETTVNDSTEENYIDASIDTINGFEIHYLDVGQADATLIMCDGEYMLFDGGEPNTSDFLYSYLTAHNISHLKYIWGSHCHSDHMGGLPAALKRCSVDVAFSPVAEDSSDTFRYYKQYVERQGLTLTVPTVGDTYSLGSAVITVLGPLSYSENINDMSLVIRIDYGDTSFLFTGDAERMEELELIDSEMELESTVLHIGHHGSDSSSIYPFIRAVAPQYAVISVGDNFYGHPTENVLSRLLDAGAAIYRTDIHGTIILSSDGHFVSFNSENSIDPDKKNDEDLTSNPYDYSFVLNKRSQKLHFADCPEASHISSKNRIESNEKLTSLIEQGYVPCGVCMP